MMKRAQKCCSTLFKRRCAMRSLEGSGPPLLPRSTHSAVLRHALVSLSLNRLIMVRIGAFSEPRCLPVFP
jgi:hypothetical protein